MLAAGTTLGPYQILALLGAGGMGEVYRARDMRLGRDVAIKVIPAELARDPERIKRFEQEARAAGALSHPNVCGILDIGTYEGAPFVVMELLEGESLRKRMDAGPVPVRKAIDYVAQAAHGLAAAHEKGIVHRDLKPENLFVTKDGRLKVLDFGLAKLTRPEVLALTGEKPVSIAATETGAILGTVGYMAPEQVLGKATDARSDLFALGTILYELLTGKRAFHGASYVETLNAILNEEPAPLSASGREIPAALESIARRCLEKSPEQRFQSASDLAFDLENLSGSGLGATKAGAAKDAARSAGSRLRMVAAFLVGVLLVGVGWALVATLKRGNDPARINYTRLTVQRGSIYTAKFSPDGKTILFTALWNGRDPEVFETRPGFPEARPVGLPGTGVVSISKRGMLAVLVDRSGPYWPYASTLAEVPIVGGTPRRLLTDILDAAWAPDGKTLVVAHVVEGRTRLEMPPGRVLRESSGILAPSVSPDGRYVAFLELGTGGPGNTWASRVVIVDTIGRIKASTRVWNLQGWIAWSASGREVWFSPSDDGGVTELRALSCNGRERVVARFDGAVTLADVGRDGRVLLIRSSGHQGILGRRSPAEDERELGWYDFPMGADISADGRWLLFGEEGIFGGRSLAVCLRGMDGSPPVKLGEGTAGRLSPDGRWALALQQGPPQQFVLLPTGAGDSTSLPRGNIESYYGRGGWMPDGKSILFSGSEPGRRRRTYIQEIQGGPPRPITPEGVVGGFLSPDGRLITYLQNDQRHVRALGSESSRVVPGGDTLALVQWTADGKHFFSFEWDSTLRFHRVEIETGKRTLWKEVRIPDRTGFQLYRPLITPSGESYAYTWYRRLDDLYLVEGLR